MASYPPVPTVDEVARHFSNAVRNSRRNEQPYRHWLLEERRERRYREYRRLRRQRQAEYWRWRHEHSDWR